MLACSGDIDVEVGVDAEVENQVEVDWIGMERIVAEIEVEVDGQVQVNVVCVEVG